MKNVSKHETYNDKFLFDTLFVLKTQIDDLEMWSVYNADKKLEDIKTLKTLYEDLKDEFFSMAQQIKDSETSSCCEEALTDFGQCSACGEGLL